MKKAIAVLKLLDNKVFPTRSRYTCHVDPGDPGRGSLCVNPGVEGLERSREETRGDVVAISSMYDQLSSVLACSQS